MDLMDSVGREPPPELSYRVGDDVFLPGVYVYGEQHPTQLPLRLLYPLAVVFPADVEAAG